MSTFTCAIPGPAHSAAIVAGDSLWLTVATPLADPDLTPWAVPSAAPPARVSEKEKRIVLRRILR
jgi:hypothetical protein